MSRYQHSYGASEGRESISNGYGAIDAGGRRWDSTAAEPRYVHGQDLTDDLNRREGGGHDKDGKRGDGSSNQATGDGRNRDRDGRDRDTGSTQGHLGMASQHAYQGSYRERPAFQYQHYAQVDGYGTYHQRYY